MRRKEATRIQVLLSLRCNAASQDDLSAYLSRVETGIDCKGFSTP